MSELRHNHPLTAPLENQSEVAARWADVHRVGREFFEASLRESGVLRCRSGRPYRACEGVQRYFLSSLLGMALKHSHGVLLGVLMVTSALMLGATGAAACPLIDGLIDYNCDRQLKIVFTGDSIVRGTRDAASRQDKGYPGRLKEVFAESSIVNLGVPGNSSLQLLSGFKRYLRADSVGRTYRASREADYFVISVGTNDFRTERPDLTVRNIVRLVQYLRATLSKLDVVAPLVIVTTITPNVREINGEFSREVNRQLLAAKRRGQLPVEVRLDDMPLRLLDDDGLHPDPKGYDWLAGRMRSFLTGRCQQLCRAQRPDRDRDGVFDLFERLLFGTSRQLRDTDGDLMSDGDELFTFGTNPLIYEPTPSPTPSP